jgi:hypothetical protein
MAITKVRVKINGTWNNLSQNSSGQWTGSITAPSTTSYRLSGKYYPVDVELTNGAGTVTTYTSSDSTFGETLKLVVKETIAPVISVTSPADGAYVTSNQPAILFNIKDDIGGSGIDFENTIRAIVDNETSYKWNDKTDEGKTVYWSYSTNSDGTEIDGAFKPPYPLSDGQHSVWFEVYDNDGNVSNREYIFFTVDTVPPALNVSSPSGDIEANSTAFTVKGTTNDTTSSPVTLTITVNDGTPITVTVNSDGSFSQNVTLAEGYNTIVVTATDAAGQTSTVTRKVGIDTTPPTIKSVSLSPNPVNTSESVAIVVEVN